MKENIVNISLENEYKPFGEMIGKIITLANDNISFINPFELGIENNKDIRDEAISNFKELLTVHHAWADSTNGKDITFEDIKSLCINSDFKISDEELLNIITECKNKN